jgi:hypothetical protein
MLLKQTADFDTVLFIVAESYDEETIHQGFTMIAEQLRGLDGKITSKRIAQHVHQLLLQNNKVRNK